MDLLTDLIAFLTGEDAPTGDRAEAVLARLREVAGADTNLTELEATVATEFWQLYNDGDYRREDADRMKALADIRDAILTILTEQAEEQAAHDTEMAALADRIRTAPDPTPAPDTTPDADVDGDPTSVDATPDDPPADIPDTGPATTPAAPVFTPPPPAAADPAAPADPAPAGSGDPTGTGGTLAAASAGRGGAPAPARRVSTAAALRRTTPTPAAPPPPAQPLRSFVITASAEVPEYPFGQSLTVEQLAEAAAARFATLPVGQPAAAPIKASVARIHRRCAPEITLTGDQTDIALIDRVADEKRLPGGSLVAAAQQAHQNLTAAAQAPSTINDVWCTPSETDYTLCPPLATREGMLDLPTAGMPARGGIRYPLWTQYPEQDADATRNRWRGQVVEYPVDPATGNPGTPGNSLDDPRHFRAPGTPPPPPAGAGYPKKNIEGPCVEWREVRQSLAYLWITSDILRDRTFPEGIQRFTSDVLIHHAHFLNETYINHIVANADKIPAFSVQNGPGQIGSTSLTVVDRLGLLVTWFRNRYKMAMGTTLEIVAPEWFKEFLKRDIEKKNNRTFGAVSDAEIAVLFAQYSSRVQWVRDWVGNEIVDGPVSVPGGRIMPPTAWPATVKLLAYPAGAWVLSEGNIIQFGVQYDYQLLQENRYSASFTEDAWMLVNRCNRTFQVELTDLCANGAVGPFRDACGPAGGTPVFLASGPGTSTTTSIFTVAGTPAAQLAAPAGGQEPSAPVADASTQPPAAEPDTGGGSTGSAGRKSGK